MFEHLFGNNAAWFGIPAVLGTFFFALRLVLMTVGGAADADVDLDADVDFDAHGDPGEAMKLLSVQSIAAFLMGFGWGGLAGLHGFDLSWGMSALAGVGTGAAMMWILGLLLKAMHDLQSSGNIDLDAAIGNEAEVYVQIPPDGRGQVRLVVDNRQRIYNAVSEAGALPRHARVRVIRVNDDRTLTVAPV